MTPCIAIKSLISILSIFKHYLSGQPNGTQETGESSALRQLLTHVPDIVINCDHKKAMPRVNHGVGVCMFADISGKRFPT